MTAAVRSRNALILNISVAHLFVCIKLIALLFLLSTNTGRAQEFDMKKELKRLSILDTFPGNPGFTNVQAMNYCKSLVTMAKDEFDYYRMVYDVIWQSINAGYIDTALVWMDKIPRDQWERAREFDYSYDYEMIRGLCYLRMGEQQNCQLNHNEYSCFFPLKQEAWHLNPTGSEKAIEMYTRVLSRNPEQYTARWLLNLAYMTLGRYPADVPPQYLINFDKFPQDRTIPYWNNIADELGVNTLTFYGGTVVEDLNEDGFLDIFTTSGALYHNVTLYYSNGKNGYRDATDKADLTGITGGGNVTHADYNNDGFIDLYILRGGWLGKIAGKLHPNSLLKNNGDGTFTDVTYETGLLGYYPSHSAGWADYDNDGWLDLFVANEDGYSQLFHNNKGVFTDVNLATGVNVAEFVKGSFWGDYNKDGLMDLYISIIGKENHLYRNNGPNAQGQFTFTNVAKEAGVTGPIISFPTFFFDYDNDGWQDLLCTSYPGDIFNQSIQFYKDTAAVEYSRLYHNNGDGTFTDVAKEFNLHRSIEAMGLNFGDIDNDGFIDFYVGSGYPSPDALMPNLLFRNDSGKQFLEVADAGFGHLQKGHGIGFGDLDNDGDQDIYASMGGFIHGDQFWNILLENPGNTNNWITLDLEGVTTNRSAIGAEITIFASDGTKSRQICRVVNPGGSFGSSSLQQEIGIGNFTQIDKIEVYWPTSKKKQTFTNVAINKVYKIIENSDQLKEIVRKKIVLAGESVGHQHDH